MALPRDNFKYVKWQARGECEGTLTYKPKPPEKEWVYLSTLKIRREGQKAAACEPYEPTPYYEAHVDAGLSFEELLKSTGCMVCDERMNRNTPVLISGTFPHESETSGMRKFELVEFLTPDYFGVHGVSPGYALETFVSLGLRPATFLELAWFAAHIRKVYSCENVWNKTIVALGSSCEDGFEEVKEFRSFFLWSWFKKVGENQKYRHPYLEYGGSREKPMLRVSSPHAINPVCWDESWKNEILFLGVHI